MSEITNIVNENIPKGSNRLMITVALIAVVTLFGIVMSQYSKGDKYDKRQLEECQKKLDNCNEQRLIESQNYLRKIESVMQLVDQTNKQIAKKEKELNNKIIKIK